MSGLTDFLFEGSPPPNVTTGGVQTTSLPQWLSTYAQGLLTKAGAVASEPYQTYGGPRIAGPNADQNSAYGLVRAQSGAYQPNLQRAGQYNSAGAGASSVGAASPYMTAAGQSLPGAIEPYMNPYISNVTNRAKDLALRSWNEDLLPGIQDTFIRNGTFASSNMLDKMLKGARDVTQNIQSAADASLAGAYQTAGTQFQQDASRFGNLAQLAGNLTNADADRQIQAGTQEQSLAELIQTLGLKDAAAMEGIGNAQQAQTQKNYDLAYQDFVSQRDYPKQQIDWMSQIMNGLPANKTTTESKTGPLPGAEYQPSGLNQLLSGATGIAGLIEMIKGWGK